MNYHFEKNPRQAIAHYADPDDFLIGKGTPHCNPEFNISKRSEYEKERAIYAIKFFYDKRVFAVWDWAKHKSHGAKSMLSITHAWDKIKPHPEMFQDFYKELGNTNSHIWEKVMVIGFDCFYEFFEHYPTYMALNEFDCNFPNHLKSAKDQLPTYIPLKERKRYSTTQLQRDSTFREKVFAAYGSRCAICRCDVPTLLEAAHEHGFEVATTSFDDPQHGICLCANHHLMYDRGLIDIDLDAGTISLKDDALKKMAWYRELISKYNARIIERITGSRKNDCSWKQERK